MKKFLVAAIGLGLILNTVSFAQGNGPKKEKKEKKTKKKKGA